MSNPQQIITVNSGPITEVPGGEASIGILRAFAQNVRPECYGAYMEKAEKLFQMGFYDHAVLEYWNRAMTDLKDKILIYGLDYFTGELNLKEVKSGADLRSVKDSQIIEGCYRLGLVDEESYVFLKHCLTVRNHFTAAHDTEYPIDPFEALNLVKNCIKYVLQQHPPSPGMNIKDLIKYLHSSNLDVDHFVEIVKDQSPKILNALLKRAFDDYIALETESGYRESLKLVVGQVWNLVDEDIKSDLGQKFVLIKLDDEVDKSLYALDFFKRVKGIKYIPVTVRKHIFTKGAEALLSAHQGFNNFYTEVAPSKELNGLGYEVPDEALHIYVKAVAFSYTVNMYGNSHGAASYDEEMLRNLSTKGVEVLLSSMEHDKSFIWHFTSNSTLRRLIMALKIIKEKSNILPKHRTQIEKYLGMTEKELRKYFVSKADEDE